MAIVVSDRPNSGGSQMRPTTRVIGRIARVRSRNLGSVCRHEAESQSPSNWLAGFCATRLCIGAASRRRSADPYYISRVSRFKTITAYFSPSSIQDAEARSSGS